MTIVRIRHNKENPFAVMSKKILDHYVLSWEAKGLWAHLMGCPDNWNLQVSHLSKHFSGGRDKVLRILRELMDHGLCFRYQERLPSGVLGEVQYIIFEFQNHHGIKELKEKHQRGEEPLPENCLKKSLLQTEKPLAANPTPTPYNNKHSSKEELNELNKTPKSPRRGLPFLLIEKRKQWATSHEWKAQGGYSYAETDRYVIISGSCVEYHLYSSRTDPFWHSVGVP